MEVLHLGIRFRNVPEVQGSN